MKPKIKITYFGDIEPTIEGDLSELEIKLVDGEEAAWLFLEHNDLSIYHTERGFDLVSNYWFSTVRGVDNDDVEAFDVRDLPEIPGDKEAKYEKLYGNDNKQLMAYAIDAGYINENGFDPDHIPS